MNFAFYCIKNFSTGLYQAGNKENVTWTNDVTKSRKFTTKASAKSSLSQRYSKADTLDVVKVVSQYLREEIA